MEINDWSYNTTTFRHKIWQIIWPTLSRHGLKPVWTRTEQTFKALKVNQSSEKWSVRAVFPSVSPVKTPFFTLLSVKSVISFESSSFAAAVTPCVTSFRWTSSSWRWTSPCTARENELRWNVSWWLSSSVPAAAAVWGGPLPCRIPPGLGCSSPRTGFPPETEETPGTPWGQSQGQKTAPGSSPPDAAPSDEDTERRTEKPTRSGTKNTPQTECTGSSRDLGQETPTRGQQTDDFFYSNGGQTQQRLFCCCSSEILLFLVFSHVFNRKRPTDNKKVFYQTVRSSEVYGRERGIEPRTFWCETAVLTNWGTLLNLEEFENNCGVVVWVELLLLSVESKPL